jgi:hypothetical protein
VIEYQRQTENLRSENTTKMLKYTALFISLPILWLNLNQSSDLIWSFDPLAESILNLVLWLDVNFDPRAGYDFNLLARSSSIFWLDLFCFDSLAESIFFDSLAESIFGLRARPDFDLLARSTSIFWLDLLRSFG